MVDTLELLLLHVVLHLLESDMVQYEECNLRCFATRKWTHEKSWRSIYDAWNVYVSEGMGLLRHSWGKKIYLSYYLICRFQLRALLQHHTISKIFLPSGMIFGSLRKGWIGTKRTTEKNVVRGRHRRRDCAGGWDPGPERHARADIAGNGEESAISAKG